MAPQIITLTTDFGAGDHYVGAMKGVIASINGGARVIDICHELRAHSIAHGAFVVAQAYRYFPKGTVHIVVVDPGVGTDRGVVLVEAAGQRFVAPDNGVLSQVYERESHTVRAVDAEPYSLKPTSQTFHGRDVFAPLGAWLSKGKRSSEFGEPISDYARLDPTTPQQVRPGHWKARVLNVDRFGNLVTSLPAALLGAPHTEFRLTAGRIDVRTVYTNYASAPTGEPFAIAGSSDYIELSIRQDSAAEAAGADIGDLVELILDEAEKRQKA